MSRAAHKDYVPGTRHATNAAATICYRTCIKEPLIILRIFVVEPGLPVRLLTRLTSGIDGQATLAHFLHPILLARPNYSRLHVARQSGRCSNSICIRIRFHATIFLEACGIARPTASIR